MVSLTITGGTPFNDMGIEYFLYTVNNSTSNISTLPTPLIMENINNIIIGNINNLCVGENIIEIIGQYNCIYTMSIILEEPSQINIGLQVEDLICFGDANGSIYIEPIGGTGEYIYEWYLNDELYDISQNFSPTVAPLTNLIGGEYILHLYDSNNCLIILPISVYEPSEFNIDINIIQPLCREILGGVEFNITGSTSPYQYIFNESIYNYNNDIISLQNGEHQFIFIDQEGCQSEEILINMSVISEDCLEIPVLFSPNGDGENDVWQIGGIENYPNTQISIYNRWGQLIFSSQGNYQGNEWDGTYEKSLLPMGVYYYIIDPINENNKTYHGGVTIKR